MAVLLLLIISSVFLALCSVQSTFISVTVCSLQSTPEWRQVFTLQMQLWVLRGASGLPRLQPGSPGSSTLGQRSSGGRPRGLAA